MHFDLDRRTASLSAGEFSSFTLGPHDSAGGASGLWRAQLGTHWHNELRARAAAEMPATEFEVAIDGQVFHRGWTLALTGRIDQLLRSAPPPPAPPEKCHLIDDTLPSLPGHPALVPAVVLREIKTVTRPLPADERELRADYPEYFVQLATYVVLRRIAAPAETICAELVFVEVGSGLAQTVALTPADEGLFRAQLDRVAEFLDLRHRARERLRGLRFRPPFATLRPGQETTQVELTATFERHPLVLFEAPTGFGKTGIMLEFALGQLRAGHFDRALYLTSKSTGQLQVVRTLSAMTAPSSTPSNLLGYRASTEAGAASTPVAFWHVRNKSEHCINHTFHCVRESCDYLAGAEARWPQSGLARFYLDENHARDLDTLRAAGREARICPYEITRAALAFNDVWIGDYNYVFAPRNRSLFFEQPGFDPARTLLLLDEAHNLPSRVADAYSHAFTAADSHLVREELHRIRPFASLLTAWDHWCHCLQHLRSTDSLSPSDEDDIRHVVSELAKQIATHPLDLAALGPQVADLIWRVPALVDELAATELPRLWWCPRDGELALTCLDAATAIGQTLREFGGVVLASATLAPIEGFSAACGLDTPPEPAPPPPPPAPDRLGALNKRQTRKLYTQLTSAADLLRVEEARDAASPAHLRAHTPWRDQAYDVAVDARVDTTFQHRSHHFATTAATVAALRDSAPGPIAVFFPSYAYADAIVRELERSTPGLRVASQPRQRDLAAQTAWVEESLALTDALFLVLGSSFAESIDALGGRIAHAMVVGPALPEVNAVQRARLAEFSSLGREAAFRRVYQIPGMTKVNQALGRLVRAPGQRARVILHCRRFLEPGYASLLAAEYQFGVNVLDDPDLTAWLAVR